MYLKIGILRASLVTRTAVLASLLSIALSGCKPHFDPTDVAEMKAFISNPGNGLLSSAKAAPFSLNLQYLPAAYLRKVQGEENSIAAEADKTATFQLRITSGNQNVAVAQLLQQRAPAEWSTYQRRQALYYGFEQLGQLQIGNAIIKPLFATVEMTTRTQQEMSILFVFPLTAAQLSTSPKAMVTLLPSFFLAKPTVFSYNTADLLTVCAR